ncbi:ABC transporter substrate-binding protein [Microbacterium sp. zg.Y1090]|uniref:ABC transporter substrate-binding protein n=1 Tax=Microbacterium wangruii TaxID=3049073 RepID=UPI00214B31E7|nr:MULTISPECIES: ABC transporter substrate-binding protein [unclassified Microbacterium]MCR2817404.1 ABC transporter substrate-binding protein [Microbacterium sp. zg.Y1090]WIM29110.1 ABC transporter substrate-binding protein [Microbacterium sp. zg-Y1090]
MRRGPIALAGMLGVSALALSACSTAGEPAANDDTPKVITVALAADPGELNPITNATEAGQIVSAYAYETLVDFTSGKDAAGALAESWTESTTEVSFTLKDGILCADGTPLTASDVKASFEYAAAEETGSPFKGVYFPASGLTIEADDDARTVTFTSEQAQSFLLGTIGLMPVVCAAAVEDPSALATTSLGTGPYALADSAPGQSYTFELRDDYTWGPRGVTSETEGLPATVTIEIVENETTIANMLQSGDVQVGTVAGADRDRLDALDLNALQVPDRPGLVFFNQNDGRPTGDPAVRQALASAIDRDAVGKVSTGGRGTELKTLVSSFSSVCTTADATAVIPAFDAAAAGAALDAAGWTLSGDVRRKDGKNLELVLLYPGNVDESVVSGIELIQQQLAEVGVTATPTPSPAYTDVIFGGGDWDLIWAPIATTLPNTWAGIMSGEFPPNGGNWTFNTNEEFFALTAQAQALAGEESCDAWTAAQESLIADAAVLPFYESTGTFYGDGVTFDLSSTGLIVPTSLRG